MFCKRVVSYIMLSFNDVHSTCCGEGDTSRVYIANIIK